MFDANSFQFLRTTDVASFSDEWWVDWERIVGADQVIADARTLGQEEGIQPQELESQLAQIVVFQRQLMWGWLVGYLGGADPIEIRAAMRQHNMPLHKLLFENNFTMFIFFWNCENDCGVCMLPDSEERAAFSRELESGGAPAAVAFATSVLRRHSMGAMAKMQEKMGLLPKDSAETFVAVHSAIANQSNKLTDIEQAAMELGVLWLPSGLIAAEA